MGNLKKSHLIAIIVIGGFLVLQFMTEKQAMKNEEQEDTASKQEMIAVEQNCSGDNCLMIKAAGDIYFDSDRTNKLTKIAYLQDLSESEQKYLIALAFESNFESSSMGILRVLINNKSLSSSAKDYVISKINELDFESNRSEIRDAVAFDRIK